MGQKQNVSVTLVVLKPQWSHGRKQNRFVCLKAYPFFLTVSFLLIKGIMFPYKCSLLPEQSNGLRNISLG